MLKPLKQSEFKMKIIKDLGTIYRTENSKTKKRFAIFECCKCKADIKASTAKVKETSRELCLDCKGSYSKNASKHRLYEVWIKQIYRCHNENSKRYKDYGGRGIIVLDLFHDFKTWLNYVESLPNAYKENYTIDRVNNDANYEPMNLRWADRSTQQQNTRKLYRHNKSGYRGVHFDKRCKKFLSKVTSNNKAFRIGFFENSKDAAIARDKYIIDNNLEHTLNFSKEYLSRVGVSNT